MRRQVDFWRFVSIAFLVIAVTLDTDVAISGVQNVSFGRPPSWHLDNHFGSLGTPWASGRARGGPEPDVL